MWRGCGVTGRWWLRTARRSTRGRTTSWPRVHIRYGGFGGIAQRLISDTYIALFSHFIPCGVWEAVYIIDGLLQNSF